MKSKKAFRWIGGTVIAAGSVITVTLLSVAVPGAARAAGIDFCPVVVDPSLTKDGKEASLDSARLNADTDDRKGKLFSLFNELENPADKDLIQLFQNEKDSTGAYKFHKYLPPEITDSKGRKVLNWSAPEREWTDRGVPCLQDESGKAIRRLGDVFVCISRNLDAYRRKTVQPLEGQFVQLLGGFPRIMNRDAAKAALSFEQFLDNADLDSDGYKARGLALIDEAGKKCGKGPDCVALTAKARDAWQAYSNAISHSVALKAMEVALRQKHEISPKTLVFRPGLCATLDARKPSKDKPAASLASGGSDKGKSGGNSPFSGNKGTDSGASLNPKIVEALFNAGPKGGTAKHNLNCPEYLPRVFCAPDTELDPTRYRREVVQTGVAVSGIAPGVSPSASVKYTYVPSGDVDLGSTSLSELARVGYEANKDNVRNELRDFVQESFIEAYLERAYFSSTSERELDSLVQQLEASASCNPGMKGKIAEMRKQLPTSGDAKHSMQRDYRLQAAMAAACVDRLQDRLASLRPLFSARAMHGKSSNDLIREDINKFVSNIREWNQTHVKDPETQKLLTAAGEMGAELVGSIPSLFTHILAMRPAAAISQKGDGPTAKCLMPPSAIDARTAHWCSAKFLELRGTLLEAAELTKQFPVLVDRLPSGEPAYKEIARSIPSSFRANGVDTYSLDPHDNSRQGEFKNCMTTAQEGLSQTSPQTLDSIKLDAAVKMAEIDYKGSRASLEAIRNAVKDLCTSKDAAGFAIMTPEVMSRYFECEGTRFGNVYARLGLPESTWPAVKLSDEECNSRLSQSYVACEEYKELVKADFWNKFSSNAVEGGGNLLASAAPLLGGLGAPVRAGMAARVGVGAGLGGLMAAPFAWMGETPETSSIAVDREIARFHSGYGGSLESLEALHQHLEELKKSEMDPRLKSIVLGASLGGVFGVITPAHLGGSAKGAALSSSAKTVAETDLALSRLLRELRESGLDLNSAMVKPTWAKAMQAARARISAMNPAWGKNVVNQLTPVQVITLIERGVPEEMAGRIPAKAAGARSPEKVFGAFRKGEAVVWKEANGANGSGRFMKFDPAKMTVTLEIPGLKKGSPARQIEVPVELLAGGDGAVVDGSFRSASSKRGINVNVALDSLPGQQKKAIYDRLKGAGLEITDLGVDPDSEGWARSLLDRYRAQVGGEPSVIYDPLTGRVAVGRGAKLSDLNEVVDLARKTKAMKSEIDPIALELVTRSAASGNRKQAEAAASAVQKLNSASRDRLAKAMAGDADAVDALTVSMKEQRAGVQKALDALPDTPEKRALARAADRDAAVSDALLARQMKSVATARALKNRISSLRNDPELRAVFEMIAKQFPDEMAQGEAIVDILKNKRGYTVAQIKKYFDDIQCSCKGVCTL